MASAYAFAAVVDRPGMLLRDYHSVQAPPEVAVTSRSVASRRDEIDALKAYQRKRPGASGTLLSTREYRVDALCRVGLWPRFGAAPFSLMAMGEALRRPRFTLYLGRRSCPLALPLQPQVVEAESFAEAVHRTSFIGPVELLKDRYVPLEWTEVDDERWHWDADVDTGVTPQQTVSRRDAVRSRGRWQFDERREHQAVKRKADGDVH
jgi:CRISPR system Cascade subunit CasD